MGQMLVVGVVKEVCEISHSDCFSFLSEVGSKVIS